MNKDWTTEAVVALQMYTAGKPLQARVVSLTTDGAEVELIDNSSGSPIMISEILINKCLAFKKEALSNQNMLHSEFPAADFQGDLYHSSVIMSVRKWLENYCDLLINAHSLRCYWTLY